MTLNVCTSAFFFISCSPFAFALLNCIQRLVFWTRAHWETPLHMGQDCILDALMWDRPQAHPRNPFLSGRLTEVLKAEQEG